MKFRVEIIERETAQQLQDALNFYYSNKDVYDIKYAVKSNCYTAMVLLKKE